ncbi:VOC family protein [Herbiconiux sp. KACC 21604]|uniref:VOC family protein n=1 Tax=unclassified Herbiconiux TaxID=2618217 RepID=UPI0014932283|nr:VOC family protein [Herbiconiux sp. SALV-R1]QJU54063.1 VOC family protein [Herbiconiux sp. SALV-R1]WPO85105.1 VOC family protein [Herbiconiux sp. KACC 21604]
MSGNGVPRRYPNGVSSWVDTEQPDTEAAAAFYGGQFGWEFANAMPPGAPGVYLIATLDGADVGAIASARPGASSGVWNTYFAVDDIDAAVAGVVSSGGTVVEEPVDVGPGGRSAAGRDPQGAGFGLWQARKRLGAQVVNVPGAWNFSNLRTNDVAGAKGYYEHLFGWRYLDLGDTVEAMIAVDGYGRHLADTADPEIFERQAGAPAGFADVIGAVQSARDGEESHWRVVFSVASREESLALAERLGATVERTDDTPWSLLADIVDPQGARLTLSQYVDARP